MAAGMSDGDGRKRRKKRKRRRRSRGDLDKDNVPGHEVVQMRKFRTRTIWIRLKQIFELKFWIWLKKVLALELKRNVAGFG